MMYNLFSFKKLLALPKTNNENHAKIISCAYVETICWSICALATSNGMKQLSLLSNNIIAVVT